MNITVNVPEGSSSHGDPNLICTPPAWYEYLLFFFTNYLAHAATIIAVPGQSVTETVCVAIAALLMPSSGIMRAIQIFIRRPAFRMRNSLNQAAAATALCMVVKMRRQNGKPVVDETKYRWMRHLSLVRERANIHGRSYLPEGYVFAYVPESTGLLFREGKVEGPEEGRGESPTEGIVENPTESKTANIPDHSVESTPETKLEAKPVTKLDVKVGIEPENLSGDLAASYNIPKAIISLAQAIWAVITLYRSRGNQIDQYGYAAFGLTVAPYAYMSIINLAATCITPEYPAIYMVRTSVMKDAEANGAIIDGEVGYLDLEQVDIKKDQDDSTFTAWMLGFLLSLPPLAVVGGLSQFSAANSSILERGFTMAWLATGIWGGLWGYFFLYILFEIRVQMIQESKTFEDSLFTHAVFVAFVVVPLAAPAVGGFVVVAKMLRECRVRRGHITGLVLDRYDYDLNDYLKYGVGTINKEAFMRELESGVHHLHSLGWAHNDLHPKNIVVNQAGMPVIIDFRSCTEIGKNLSTSRGTKGWFDGEMSDYTMSEKSHDLIGMPRAWKGPV